MERITEESEKQIKLRSIKPSAMGRGQKNILLFACDLRSQRYSVFPGISEYFRTLKKKKHGTDCLEEKAKQVGP